MEWALYNFRLSFDFDPLIRNWIKTSFLSDWFFSIYISFYCMIFTFWRNFSVWVYNNCFFFITKCLKVEFEKSLKKQHCDSQSVRKQVCLNSRLSCLYCYLPQPLSLPEQSVRVCAKRIVKSEACWHKGALSQWQASLEENFNLNLAAWNINYFTRALTTLLLKVIIEMNPFPISKLQYPFFSEWANINYNDHR